MPRTTLFLSAVASCRLFVAFAVVLVLATAHPASSVAATLDFEALPTGRTGNCDGPPGQAGTYCTLASDTFSFEFIADWLVDDGTVFPVLIGRSKVLAPTFIPEIEHPLIVSFPATNQVAVDLYKTGQGTNAIRIEALGEADVVLAAQDTATDAAVLLVSATPIRSLRLFSLGGGSISGFAIDNLSTEITCPGDLAQTQQDLATCHGTLASTQTTLTGTQTALATCESNLTGVEADLAAATADADGDGVRDLYDDCPGTPASVAVDRQGCSQAQFCGAISVLDSTGRKLCLRADWKNDEPLMRSRERDCAIDRNLPGPADDLCVASS